MIIKQHLKVITRRNMNYSKIRTGRKFDEANTQGRQQVDENWQIYHRLGTISQSSLFEQVKPPEKDNEKLISCLLVHRTSFWNLFNGKSTSEFLSIIFLRLLFPFFFRHHILSDDSFVFLSRSSLLWSKNKTQIAISWAFIFHHHILQVFCYRFSLVSIFFPRSPQHTACIQYFPFLFFRFVYVVKYTIFSWMNKSFHFLFCSHFILYCTKKKSSQTGNGGKSIESRLN